MNRPSYATEAAARLGLAATVRRDAAEQAQPIHATCVSNVEAARPGPWGITQA